MTDLLTALTESGLVAIIRCPGAGTATPIGRTLIEAGVTVLEVTLTTPDALEAISELRALDTPGVLVGAGTVLTVDDLDSALEAGAQFIVTPSWAEAVPAAVERGVPVVPGAWTPSEVHQADAAGATAVKLFPARTGGPAHLKAIRDPFPRVPLVAVGGVGPDDVVAYREAGAIAVGVGGPLVGDAATGGSLDDLGERARDFVERCRR
ncbi:bifunctional 4-hydroxy-2-oxoglutarate aldolase/2-dehydro-3-deoxy-phosphogluconate aldolase [Aestuariimicrobium ganziense]|uniref:bifunctional 4-hydroxy-2-oxoglutarate aldolase/2-dehydro-3-deoxy-phosphogluconate aldolase n=1 Tax=Aestuariimicrobium ganziense TaxID=2773677 RepID=UPI001944AB1B|nr:bifunctional 4-hydroxy-2-oxoglutarate aldolase/2-dehydro-3-deoxy-phosphogluconate aldolase [Aestuariimicrobium ganziense]